MISVIVPQFAAAELTLACVESLYAHEPQRLQVLIVDDGSAPDIVRTLQTRVPSHVQFIRISANQGVTHAWNRGAAHARGNWLIFLNNDVISSGAWCDRFIAGCRKNQRVIAGPGFRSEPHLPQRLKRHLATNRLLEGWCLGMSRRLFETINGFDERFVMYFSDSDLQCRILEMTQSAHLLKAVKNLPLKHQGHATTQQLATRRRQWIADRDAFLEKWSD